MADIEKMLAGGATPEEIYQEALRIAKAKKAEEKMNKQILEARKAMIQAFANYMEVLTGEKADAARFAEFERDFAELEKCVTRAEKHTPKTKKSAPAARTASNKKVESDEYNIVTLLKSLGEL